MDININKKAAEVLIACGYACGKTEGIGHDWWVLSNNSDEGDPEYCDFYKDTLEGRRQADALEDWLTENAASWGKSLHITFRNKDYKYKCRKWRLARIKWCLEQLAGEDNGS